MCQGLTRRSFLQMAGLSLINLALMPRLVVGQSNTVRATGGKNLVFVNLYGGLDGLYAFPYLSGSISDLLYSAIRPALSPARNSLLEVQGQAGRSQKMAFHPSFAPLFNRGGAHCAVIEGYGIPGDPGRSHDACQVLMSLGQSERTGGGDMVGFLARLMDLLDWESFQYWALMTENPSDINTQKRQPMAISNVDQFDLPRLGWERKVDGDYAEEVAQALSNIAGNNNPREVLFSESVKRVRQSVAQVQNSISTQSVGNNVVGDYSDSSLGRSLRDAAKIIKAKGSSADLQLSGKDLLILAGQGGFDTHSDQVNPNASDGNLPGLLSDLALNFAVFYQDLESASALQDTVVVSYSEFGRTVFGNGRAGEASIGTDHGHGSNTLVFGGPVQAGVYGSSPTASELSDPHYNALRARVDFRDIFSEIFTWMGVDPKRIFADPSYQPQRLDLSIYEEGLDD